MNSWKPLLDVQALDTALDQIEHRDAQLTERQAIAEIETELVALRQKVEVADAEKHTLVKDQKRIEDEIALLNDKIAGVEKQLYSGGSSDAKELQAFQDEIDSIKKRISHLEDNELELMEQVEPIDARLATLAREKDELDARAITLTASLAEAESIIAAERDDLRGRRSGLVEDINEAVMAEYERQRARLGGVAVARLESGVCGACHMKLSAVEYDRIQHLPDDETVTCEDCERVLVRG